MIRVRFFAPAAAAIAISASHVIAACTFFDQHPPEVDIKLDASDAGRAPAARDAGAFRTVTLPAGWDAGSGGR